MMSVAAWGTDGERTFCEGHAGQVCLPRAKASTILIGWRRSRTHCETLWSANRKRGSPAFAFCGIGVWTVPADQSRTPVTGRIPRGGTR